MKVYVLLYPETLGDVLQGYGAQGLFNIAKHFASNPCENNARFSIIKGVFPTEQAARNAAAIDHAGRECHWAEDFIVKQYEFNCIIPNKE